MSGRRELFEIRVGDYIQFSLEHRDEDGIVTAMVDAAGQEWPLITDDDRTLIKAMVIHRTSDSKYSVIKTDELPSWFHIIPKPRYPT